MSLYVSNKSTEVIYIHLKSFEVIKVEIYCTYYEHTVLAVLFCREKEIGHNWQKMIGRTLIPILLISFVSTNLFLFGSLWAL